MGGAGGVVRLRGMEYIHGSEAPKGFTAVNIRNGVQTRHGARAAIAATTSRMEEQSYIGGSIRCKVRWFNPLHGVTAPKLGR